MHGFSLIAFGSDPDSFADRWYFPGFFTFVPASHLPALLSICTSVIEDIHIHCQFVHYNCTETLLLVDVFLVILSDDFMLLSFYVYYSSVCSF